MVLILIALIATLGMAIYANTCGRWDNFFTDIVATIFGFFSFVGLLLYCFFVYAYIAADYKKDIINREYGTSYTQLEVFYASDVIDTVRELDRKRIELNGDLVTGK